ncbi:aa3-type cytochrome c oxidase subunit IV [Limibaculum sp. M0105]|uniref:Aa3-type cytochrome c oxidase subunit IV n=1 Tax=Thermohalobaculum xanthum TaxID=2753746 RepID=A0A8J7SJ62_9RHOB|nr:aa3-type cytochrome c oxidase subunit IV [Thermohalobaculum xanthum]MBK0400760.1 aa3-type cytochrome c oxidase subunit IV [Thermohalobaculum xanthum]
MASHEHGSMDISAHERTFEGFLKACAIVAVGSALILILLAFVGT